MHPAILRGIASQNISVENFEKVDVVIVSLHFTVDIVYFGDYFSTCASAIVLLTFIHPVYTYRFTPMISTTISWVFERDVLTTAFINE